MLQPGRTCRFGRLVRQQAALATRPPFFYPFAFPANAWFAWRTGLPIDRYDLLAPESLQPSIDVAIDASREQVSPRGLGTACLGSVAAICDGLKARVPSSSCRSTCPAAHRDRRDPRAGAIARIDASTPAAVSLAVNGRRIGTFTPDAQRSRSSGVFVVPARTGHLDSADSIASCSRRNADGPPVAIYRMLFAVDEEPCGSHRACRWVTRLPWFHGPTQLNVRARTPGP